MTEFTATATAAFEHYFDRLMALVHERLEVEWQFHKRTDLQRLEPDLLELLREFGALLRVVYRYDLREALAHEASWYASTLASRGPGEDALALLLDSWIVAIQGLIKPPECNILAAPLQRLRENVENVFAEIEARPGFPASPEISAVVDLLIKGDHASARGLLRARMATGVAPYEVIVQMLLPAMSEIGRRWELNELAIFEEHISTETVQRLIAELPAWSPPARPLHRMALITCVPHDEHQVLPLALSAYLELRGWHVRSLGRSLPGDQIVKASMILKPDVIFASLSMLSRLTEAIDLLTHLRKEVPRCRIFIGGRGAEPGRELLEAGGAMVVQDFGEAHRRALEGSPPHAR